MHTILGAGGPISNALERQLAENNHSVRLVSRKPIATSGKTIWQKGNLLNLQEVLNASRDSDVIYLCAGLKYDMFVWQEQWPKIMENVINATRETGARLIFFDNVYMYGLVKGSMTEDTPYNPNSAKGEVRARIAGKLMDEAQAGNIKASIARSADFYGATESMNSFFDMMILDKLSKKQSPQWLGNPNSLHSFTYVPDAARGVFLLGQSRESDNQIWHMPTAPPQRGIDLINLAAEIFNRPSKYMKINRAMLQLIGLFNPLIKSTVEMYYQYQHDYHFDSSKFEKAFNQKPVSYKAGITYLANTYYSHKNS
ncbi:MAG TPA: NAD-dependent epimerase/dehydratase family protein [Pedobacter sp.]|jgi:nucleoside-diphosphate-sugar epimerase